MADTTDGNPWVLPADLSYASIDTALAASEVAYGTIGTTITASTAYDDLVGGGWTEIILPTSVADVSSDHYQGVAFYKVVNGVTEVIIANRGSWPGGDGSSYLYDYTVSDADLARGANPACNASAVAYYEEVSSWVAANITAGTVQIIETGHSLGGEEADYVQAEITDGYISSSYATATITFDAPGLPKTPAGLNQPGVDALNVSLSTDPVHSLGAEFNVGYAGQSVTVNGGVSAWESYGIGGVIGLLIGEVGDHSASQLSGYLSVSPALGGVNLYTYQPDQITQSDVGTFAQEPAGTYDWLDPSELATYYQGVFGAPGSGGGSSSSGGDAQETFTSTSTDSGVVLTGSEGDSITIAESDSSGSGSPDTITITDNSGDQLTMTSSADGSYVASDSWEDAQGMTGTDTYEATGSSSGKVVYASGGYATYFADGLGNITWDYYNSAGNLFSWSWAHSDGSSGTGAEISNGLTLIPDSTSSYDVVASSFSVDQNPDGSYVDYSAAIGGQEATSQFNASGSLTSTSTAQGPGENYDLSDTTTQTSTDSSGDVTTLTHDAAGDLVSQSVQYASGASTQITYNASGATTEKDVNVDNSSDIIYTDGGDRTENFYNSSGVLTGDTWSLSDGTTGQDTFNVDGSGSGTITYSNGATSTLTVDSSLDITITNKNSSGQTVSEDWWQANGTYGITVYDSDGTYATYDYLQNGNVVETEYAADQSVALQETVSAGGMLSPDGSEFGTITNADGSSSIDYVSSNGDAIVFNVSAGQLGSVDHASAQPNSGEFGVSLVGDPTSESPYNDNTAVFTGSDGTQYVEYMNSAGVATGEDWTSPGGSYGYATFNSDGSSSAITYNPDGTYYTATTDAAGDTTTDYYDSTGTLTSDSWSDVSGAYGGDQYNSDGSSSGTYINADGSYSEYTDDGQGNITEWDYSYSGNLESSEWQTSNGGYGSEVANADGSIDGTQYQANGSYATFAIDPQGDNLSKYYSDTGQLASQAWSFTDGNGSTITYSFDASGTLLQESWASADGATETVSGAIGSNLLNTLSADRVDGAAISGAADGGTLQALGNEDTVSAVGGQNVIYALGTADELQGASGSDTLIALGADATLDGGTGNEVFEVNDPTDVVQAQADAASNEIYSSMSYTLPAHVDVLTLTGTGDINAYGNDDAANVITGNSGNDAIAAGSGNDTLVSGSGVDTFYGGNGPDTFVVNNSSDVISGFFNALQDTVESSVSYVLTVPVATLVLTGSADVSATDGYGRAEVTGNAGNDTLAGGASSDTLVAGTGVDTFVSGTGNNTFVINSANDVIQVSGGAGSDTVESSVSYTLGQGLDSLELTGSANLDGQGNADSSNLLEANAGDDLLTAGSGDDTLIGGGGDDTLVAGSGADTLEGGSGSATYLLNSGFGQAEIEPGSGSGVIQFGTGINPSDLAVSLTTDSSGNPGLLIQDGSSAVTVAGGLTASINEFDFSDGSVLMLGGLLAAADVTPGTVAGASGNAILSTSDSASLSGSGDDTLVGTGGSDTLVAGTGDEDLLATGASASVSGGVGADTLIGSGADDTVEAGNGNQQLYGLGTGDVLIGGLGDDTLYGGTGPDTLVAGTGNTIMYGSSAGDSIVLSAGGTVTLNPSSTSTTELIELPSGMTLADFTASEGANGSLILQSLSDGTTAVINGFYSSGSSGTLWMIANSSGQAQLLSDWLDSLQPQPGSGYDQEINSLREAFAANLEGTLNQIGQQGGTVENPGDTIASYPGYQYQFTGVSTENVTVQGGTLTVGNSDNYQSTTTTLQTGSTTESVTTPVYGEVTVPGWQEFIPASSFTPNEIVNLGEINDGNGLGISIGEGTEDGVAGYIVSSPAQTEIEETGTQTTLETVPVYTSSTQVTQGLTANNITGDGGNDVITTGPIIYNQYEEDVGPYFVGTVNTGNGNVLVDLGMNNWVEPLGDSGTWTGTLAEGAFIQAGDGSDTIIGTGGADVIAAGTGIDNIEAAFGSTVYVPLEGASTENIDVVGPFYGGAPLPPNTLVLPTGITPQDLTYRLFTGVTNATDQYNQPMDTLQISYGDSSVLIDFSPSTNNGLDYLGGVPRDDINGIDTFQFSDGTVLTRNQLLAMAGTAISASTLNPSVTAGETSVDANVAVQGSSLFGGSDSSGLPITWYEVSNTGANGGYFEVNGVAQTPGQSFYVSVDQLPDLTYVSGSAGTSDDISVSAFDGVVWGSTNSFSVSAASSSLYEATGADQEIVGGSSGPDTLVGGYGGDTLVGSSGQDTFEYNTGSGAESISETASLTSASDNVLAFGPGITPATLTLAAAAGSELVLSTGAGGDSVSIEGFDPLNPLQSFPVQSFAFPGGTSLTLLQLLSDSAVTGASGGITNADGSVTSYQFTPGDQQIYYAQTINSSSQIVQSIAVNDDGSTDAYSYTYNADGSYSQTQVTTPAGGGGPTTQAIDYNSQNQYTSFDITNPDGSTDDSVFTYNADGSYSQTEVITPAGGGGPTTQVIDYNSQNQYTSFDITNPDGSTDDSTITYNADGSYSQTEVITPAGGGGPTTQVIDYNSQNQYTSFDITNPDGSTDDSAFTYNADGSSTRTEVVTPAGGGGSTTTVYDVNSQGQQTSVDITNPDGSTDDSTYAYNSNGSQTVTDVSTLAGQASTTTVSEYCANGSLMNQNVYTPGSDGSYTDSWTMANGSYGSYWWNASTSEYQETWTDSNGSSWTDDYQYAAGGSPGATGYSFTETYEASDGSEGSRQYDASTGAVTLSWDSASTGELSGTTTDSGFIGLQNEGELTNTQADLTFFNPNASTSFSAFLAAH